jgi:2-phosphoglycerate kinase
MLLLIGGAPGIGKSTVAHEVARELGLLRLVDVDVIRDLLRIQSREQDDPMLFRNALNAYELHGALSASTVLAGFQAHVRPLVGATARLVDSYLSTGKSAVIHGVPLIPNQFARYRTRGVQFVLLASRDEESYRKRLGDRGRVRAGRVPADDRLDAGWFIHQNLVADAQACGVPVIAEETAAKAASALLRRISS